MAEVPVVMLVLQICAYFKWKNKSSWHRKQRKILYAEVVKIHCKKSSIHKIVKGEHNVIRYYERETTFT